MFFVFSISLLLSYSVSPPLSACFSLISIQCEGISNQLESVTITLTKLAAEGPLASSSPGTQFSGSSSLPESLAYLLPKSTLGILPCSPPRFQQMKIRWPMLLFCCLEGSVIGATPFGPTGRLSVLTLTFLHPKWRRFLIGPSKAGRQLESCCNSIRATSLYLIMPYSSGKLRSSV